MASKISYGILRVLFSSLFSHVDAADLEEDLER